MFRFSRWKVTSIIAMTLAAMLIILPSFLTKERFEPVKKALPKWIPFEQVVLGLDLQGGAHIMLEVDQSDVLRTLISNMRDDVRRTLREENVRSLTGGYGVQGRAIQFRVSDARDRERILPKLRQMGASAPTAMGTAGIPNMEVTVNDDGLIRMTVTEAGLNEKTRRAVEQAIEVIRRRVDALGTTEPNIQRQGLDRVLVQVPGLQDTNRLKEILGTTAKLEFRLVADTGYNPADVDMLPQTDQPGTLPVEKQVMVQGEDLTDAQPGFDQRTSEPVVN